MCESLNEGGRAGHQLKDQLSAVYLAKKFKHDFVFNSTEYLDGFKLEHFSKGRIASLSDFSESRIQKICDRTWVGSKVSSFAKHFQNCDKNTIFVLTTGTRVNFSNLIQSDDCILKEILKEFRDLHYRKYPDNLAVLHIRRGDLSPVFPLQLIKNRYKKKYKNHDFINIRTYEQICDKLLSLHDGLKIEICSEKSNIVDVKIFAQKRSYFFDPESSVIDDFTKMLNCSILVCSNSSLSNITAFARNKPSLGFVHEQFNIKNTLITSLAEFLA